MDIVEFLGEEFLDKKCLEIGTASGHTTRLLSFLFKEVETWEIEERFIKESKMVVNKDRNNIVYVDKKENIQYTYSALGILQEKKL